jgi:hypothetical protein
MKGARVAFVAVVCGAALWAAIALARVDAPLGEPKGPDRLVNAIDNGVITGTDRNVVAKDILSQRPIDGRAFRVLAQSEGSSASDKLLGIAVKRAPRDRFTRAVSIERAFASGDVEAGMLHLDALLRVVPGAREDMLRRLAFLLGHEEIQTAVLARLQYEPDWRAALVAALKSPDVPAEPALRLLERLSEKAMLQPHETDARIALLNRLGRNQEARGVWLRSLPASARNRADAMGVFDGGFEQPDINGGFGWRITDQPGLTVAYDDVTPIEGQRSLLLEFDGRAISGVGVEQSIALPAGRYRLSTSVENTTDAARAFLMEVVCQGATSTQLSLELPVATRGWQRSQDELSIPASGCAGQVLRLRYPARSLQERMVSGALRLDEIRLTPLQR